MVERGGNIHEAKKKKKKEGSLALAPPPVPRPPRFPGVQLNSLPTHRRALLSERLEQAKRGYDF